MGSSNTLPPTASGIPPIGQLRGMLGYGDETNGRVDFQRNCASFIDDHFYQENINRDNFCNWKDNAHKTLFTNLASQYLRINGRRFWPDRDTVDSDPAQLRWPQENATIEPLLAQLFFRINYDKRRNDKKKLDERSQQGPRKKHRTRSSTSARTNMPQLQPAEGHTTEPASSAPSDIGTSSSHALARLLDYGTDLPVVDDQDRSCEEHVNLSEISENDNDNENEQARPDTHQDHTLNIHRRHSNPSDTAMDVHGPSVRGRAPVAAYIVESGESSTQSSMAENTMPAQVDPEHVEPSATHGLPQQKRERNSQVESTVTGRSAKRRDREGVNEVAGSRDQPHPQVTEQSTDTGLTKNKFRMYYYINGRRNTQSRVPWWPKGNFTELTLEELIQQLHLENNPDALYFRLVKPGVGGPVEMEVTVCPADAWKFGLVQKTFKEEVHNVVRTRLSSSQPITCMVEIEPKWDETKYRSVNEVWTGSW